MLVLSASPSRYGGIRAAEHLRAVLGRIGAAVQPTGLSVASAHQRLDPASPTHRSRPTSATCSPTPSTARLYRSRPERDRRP